MKAQTLAINVNNLIAECSEQPERMCEAGVAFAEASGAYKRAKVVLERDSSLLAQKVRDMPSAYGLGKVSEKAIQEVVTTNDDIHNAAMALADAEQDMILARCTWEAYTHRQGLIRAEVEMHNFNYNATQRSMGAEQQREGESELVRQEEEKVAGARKRGRGRGKTKA